MTKALAVADGKCHHKTRAGAPCKNPVKPGDLACFKHGADAPHLKAAAAIRVRRDKAQQEALARLKAEKAGRINTITEMDRLAAEAIAFKDVCREHMEKTIHEMRYEGKTGEQIRAEVVVYERALDRCNTILATNVKLGIHEKRAELDKQKAIIVAAAIRAILSRLDLSFEQQKQAPRIIQEEMLAIAAEVE